MYILRICKKFGYSRENLHYLFNTLIMSLFKCVLPVWGCASYSAYLVNIDKLQNRAVKFGYLKYTTPINDLIEIRITQFGIMSKIIPGTLLHIYYLRNEQES